MPIYSRRTLRPLVLAAAMLGSASPALAQADTQASLSLSATGSVTAVPDMARLQLEVSAEALTAQAALADVATRLTAVFAALDAAGIAAADRQTSSIALDPQHEHDERGRPLRLRGYAARQALNVTLRDLDGLGTLLDTLTAAGLDGFGSFAFDVADRDALLDEARRRAVAEAARTANLLAEAAGQRLGAPLEITLQGGSAPRPAPMRAAMADAGGMPVAEGVLEISATVTVRYSLE